MRCAVDAARAIEAMQGLLGLVELAQLGVGRRAATLLWDRLPRRWIVRVSEGNRGAMLFWESTVSVYSRGQLTQSMREGSPHAWRDFSFVSPVDRNL